MIYSVDLEIPANTPDSNPEKTILMVTWGVVTQVWVRWSWGPGNLCGVRVKRQESQVWPLTLGEWFNSTSRETTWNDYYNVGDQPLYFDVEGYNLDDTFSHTVTVVVNVQRPTLSDNVKAFFDYLLKGA